MTLATLFKGLCDLLCEDDPIERHAAAELRRVGLSQAAGDAAGAGIGVPTALPAPILEAMNRDSAHPICRLIETLPFRWAPPRTSRDPLYREHSHFKVHVELLGPAGLLPSSRIRLGLYGMLPHSEYGLRTHPAEETYIMLAGSAFWMLADAPYQQRVAGQRSHHPSMMPHATRTGAEAFMSIYIWDGDISTDQYSYFGLPED